jgi:hypothetical protein
MVVAPCSGVDEQKAAHRFVGALLVAADVLRAEVGVNRSSISIGELVVQKKRFGASIWALTIVARILSFNQGAFARLFKTFGDRGWRTAPFEEPETMKPELEEPKRFERPCYRALAERVIGECQAAELLGISCRELGARLDRVAA